MQFGLPRPSLSFGFTLRLAPLLFQPCPCDEKSLPHSEFQIAHFVEQFCHCRAEPFRQFKQKIVLGRFEFRALALG